MDVSLDFLGFTVALTGIDELGFFPLRESQVSGDDGNRFIDGVAASQPQEPKPF